MTRKSQTIEESMEEHLCEFTKATSEALQELVVVLKQLDANVVELGGKLDRLIELESHPPSVVHLHPRSIEVP